MNEDMVRCEFVLISRKIFNHPVFKEDAPFSRAAAWIDMIFMACYDEYDFKLKKSKKNLHIRRGESFFTIKFLGEKWKWSRTKVRNFLKDLEKEDQISIRKEGEESLFFIKNYDKYQDTHFIHKKDEGHPRGHLEGHPRGHLEGHPRGHLEGHLLAQSEQGIQRGVGHPRGHPRGHLEGHPRGHLEGHLRGHLIYLKSELLENQDVNFLKNENVEDTLYPSGSKGYRGGEDTRIKNYIIFIHNLLSEITHKNNLSHPVDVTVCSEKNSEELHEKPKPKGGKKKENFSCSPDDVEEVYKAYPATCFENKSRRLKSGVKDKKKITSILEKGEFSKEKLLEIIGLYVKSCKPVEGEFVPALKNFSTFLNNIPDYEEDSLLFELSESDLEEIKAAFPPKTLLQREELEALIEILGENRKIIIFEVIDDEEARGTLKEMTAVNLKNFLHGVNFETGYKKLYVPSSGIIIQE